MNSIIFKITNNVKVSVKATYINEYSNPLQSQFAFGYTIRIENNNDEPIQLLQRYWNIVDATNFKRVVEGEGVVGKQAIIEANSFFEYSSFTSFETQSGYMDGYYTMKYMKSKSFFQVEIPKFFMQYPYSLN